MYCLGIKGKKDQLQESVLLANSGDCLNVKQNQPLHLSPPSHIQSTHEPNQRGRIPTVKD